MKITFAYIAFALALAALVAAGMGVADLIQMGMDGAKAGLAVGFIAAFSILSACLFGVGRKLISRDSA